jgi:RES domain-containing protein
MRHYGMSASDRVIIGTRIRAENILDLTNPDVRSQLGVRLEDLISDDYTMTHAIGDFARTRYRGLLAPSARAYGTSNLVLFGDP